MSSLPILSGLNDHQLAALIILALIVQVMTIFKLRTTERQTRTAVSQTVGTSNGFAKHVLEKLDELRASSGLLQHSLDFVQSTQDDQRQDIRDMQARVQRIEERQAEHSAFHAKAGK
jgi:uncharacterized membrane protein